ncbi:MAG: type II secretion system protein [Acidimicrobiia bacterium]
MSRRVAQNADQRRDGGFTLVEALIVVTVLGLIVTTLAGAFMVIVRTTPSAEIRVDDARSTRGLATWLSHDTTSTPPYDTYHPQGWIDVSPTRNDCVADGENILHLTWVENSVSAVTTFHVSYRYVVSGGTGSVVRYACSSAGDSRSLNLTAGLTVKPNIVLNHNAAGDVDSVDFVLTAPSGAQVVVQTGSRNPMEFFS